MKNLALAVILLFSCVSRKKISDYKIRMEIVRRAKTLDQLLKNELLEPNPDKNVISSVSEQRYALRNLLLWICEENAGGGKR